MADTAVKPDVQIEDAGPARKRLTITIPAETVDGKLDDSLTALAAETTLPGFRKGRAPRNLLERRFGDAMQNEARNQLLAEAYSSAIEEHEIKPVGDPEPVDDAEELTIEPGKALTFSVHVEIVPEFEVPSLDGIDIKKPMLEITDQLIEDELNRQCIHLGTPKDIDNDFKPGDRLQGIAIATKQGDEEPFFRSDEAAVIIPAEEDNGRGPLLGLMIDDLGDRLTPLKVGETFTVETKGPELHEREDIRGADITISFEIRKAQRLIPAALEKVVENYGLASEDILREQIKMALEQRRDDEQAAAMREQVNDYLTQHIDFPLPEKMSAMQAHRALEQRRLELLYRGVDPDRIESILAEIRTESDEQARNRLKLSFILHKLAQQFEIQVTDQEINGRIASIAMQRGMRPDQLRNDLIKNNQLNQIAVQLREHKTADRVLSQATLTEISADDWQKLVEAKQADRKAASKKKTTKKKTTKKKASASKDTGDADS
jgi:trigger factor